ncbi:MAG TPA: hypothetical protein PLZ74_06615 [Kiritimatiellia bacterium]|nr:hypothetical protein [Kiritimatiellia bacterium]
MKGKRNVLAAVALAAAFAFADDGYLVVGHGGLMEKGGDSPIAKELVARFSPKNGTAVAVDVVEVTNAVALKACAPKSYAGIILVPGFDTGKMKDHSIVNAEHLAAMNALLDSVRAKAVVAVEEGGDFENYQRLRDAFAGRAAVITTRDGGARLAMSWGRFAPEGMRRIALALKHAADPAKRDGIHPLPGKVTMEESWMVLDFETPALQGQSLIVSDTLFRKFYVRSAGKTNWTRIDNLYVEDNKVYLDCSKISNPGGVRLNWWHLSPFKNIDHLPTPGFVLALDAGR